MSQEIQKQTSRESIEHLPESVLLALARNEAAQSDFRLAAVELMIDNGFGSANHPELALLAQEVQRRVSTKAEVSAIVESATEESLDDVPDTDGFDSGFDWKSFIRLRKGAGPDTAQEIDPNAVVAALKHSLPKLTPDHPDVTGPFKASVTTATMQAEGE